MISGSRYGAQLSIRLIFVLLVACNSSTPTTPVPSLPGASGTPMSIISPLDAGLILDVYMTAEHNPFGAQKILPPVFPSGVTQLDMVAVFSPSLPGETKFSVAILGNGGPVELKQPFGSSTLTSPSKGTTTVSMTFEPLSGKFTDGPYQAMLSINGKAVALLNWTVGSP